MQDLLNLVTEQQNLKSRDIDEKTTVDILTVINEEDQSVPLMIQKSLPDIALVVDEVVKTFQKGGRLIYVGAGTSGRIGILDAAECPPTFGTDPEMVKAVIAGGSEAIFSAIEGAEDNESLGKYEMEQQQITSSDIVIGITASGRAPFVIGALKEAKNRHAATVSLTCTKNAELNQYGDYHINIEVGPEVITGSTRMKAGTSQKLVLNMITTTSMIKIGKTFGNLMVDVKPLNKKLVERAKWIIQSASHCTKDEAGMLFEQANGNPKIAIVMHTCKVDAEEAKKMLSQENGVINQVIKKYNLER